MLYTSLVPLVVAAVVSARDSPQIHRVKAFDSISLPYSQSYLQINENAVFDNQPPLSSDTNHTIHQAICPQSSSLKVAESPWISPPHCMFPARAGAVGPVCAFVSRTFAGGRGIALITTPSRAAEILSYDAFTQSQFPPGTNKYWEPPFEERDLPGRGKGLIANQTLHSGDRIFASTPMMIIDEAVEGLAKKDRLELSYHALQSLPEELQTKFWAMAGQDNNIDPLGDRIDTNSFGIEIAGASFWAIFPEMARLNHDCRPNNAYFFDDQLLTQYVHVTTTVPSGTELTISYIDAGPARAKRQRMLHLNWGFSCSCSLCSMTPALSHASDSRLRRISELTRKLGDWRPGSEASVDMALAVVDLVELEELRAALPDAYIRVALQYSAQGNRWGAVRWASKSLQSWLLEYGWRDEGLKWVRQLQEEPEAHWSWRARVNGGGIDYVEHEE